MKFGFGMHLQVRGGITGGLGPLRHAFTCKRTQSSQLRLRTVHVRAEDAESADKETTPEQINNISGWDS